MTLTCLPAILHVYPERITQAVEEAVAKHRGNFDQIFVVYADCGTGGLLQKACEDMGVEMIKDPIAIPFLKGIKPLKTMAMMKRPPFI